MKKIIKNSITIYIGIVLGIFVSIVLINADNSLNASSINIDKTNMPNISGTTLNSALDYLYERASKTNLITIESGIKHDTQTYLGIAYLDPTDLTAKCNSYNSTSNVEQKTGCMKWYIYGQDSSGNYLAILDHNVKERQAWNTDTDVTQYGTNVPYEQSLVYSVIQLLTSTGSGGSNWDTSLSPRLISAYEVADIVGKEGFTNTSGWFYLDSKNQSTYPNYQGGSNYAWLFDNLGWNDQYGDCTNYGCNYSNTTNSAAYWTSTPYGTAGAGSIVWGVDRNGNLNYYRAYTPRDGIRPVITISSSIIS